MALDFSYDKRHYSLKFNAMRILRITGESAVGKSLMCSDALRRRVDKHGKKIRVVRSGDADLFTSSAVDTLVAQEYKYFIVDNADILLTPELEAKILDSLRQKNDVYWVLLGRKPRGFVSHNCVGVLKRDVKNGQHYFSVDYSTV
jgi:hypothetical protein